MGNRFEIAKRIQSKKKFFIRSLINLYIFYSRIKILYIKSCMFSFFKHKFIVIAIIDGSTMVMVG